MIDLGDPQVLSVTTTDAAGAPANPTAIVLTVTLPDGTTATPVVTSNPTGTHTATYSTTQAGRHTVSWVATGTNMSAYADVFNVEAAGGAIISLAEAKAHLGITRTTDDEEIRSFNLAASSWVERRIGPVTRQTKSQVVHPNDGFVWLDGPVISLTSIVAVYGGATPTLDVATVTAQSPEVTTTGRVWLGWGFGFCGPLLVTYVAGMAVVPPLVRSAVKDYLKWDWLSQRGASPTAVDLADELASVPGTVPFKIAQKLDSYAPVVVA